MLAFLRNSLLVPVNPLSPTLFGIFFDSLDAQLQAESAAAGVECRGVRVPGLFYADDVALLSPSAQGLQQRWTPCSRSVSPTGLQSAS